MSSVMARTPTVTRHSDFMAAAAAAEQEPPGLAELGLRGRANRGPRPAAPGGATASPPLGGSAPAALPGMLIQGCSPGSQERGQRIPKYPGGGSCPQGFLTQPEAPCALGMALLERLARCGRQRQRAFWKTSGGNHGKIVGENLQEAWSASRLD